MKEILTFVLLFLTVRLNASERNCEKKEFYAFSSYESTNTCYMTILTTIDSPGFTISSRDETIGGLMFDGNRKIRFLPENVVGKFPNLFAYWAQSCSVTKISKTNFAKLVKLKDVRLYSNQIQKIPSNTFADLRSLERLDLGRQVLFCLMKASEFFNKIFVFDSIANYPPSDFSSLPRRSK